MNSEMLLYAIGGFVSGGLLSLFVLGRYPAKKIIEIAAKVESMIVAANSLGKRHGLAGTEKEAVVLDAVKKLPFWERVIPTVLGISKPVLVKSVYNVVKSNVGKNIIKSLFGK